MNRLLKEQLERIHRLNYGNDTIKSGFVSKILSEDVKKVDDPKKADLVTDNVKMFFDTLQKSAEQGGISQQERGSMTFQKEVESMQIGLMLLGYELPKYGVDGLFGPETATAVDKFTKEKLIKDSTINEAVKLVSQGGGIIGKPGHGTHSASDWQSGNAWDVTGPVGTEVYSITSGIVDKIRKDSGSGVVKSGVKKIYGDQVSIRSTDGKPNIFYTHIDSTLNVGDSVKEGDVVGTIIQAGGITPHVHVGVSSGNLSDLASGMSDGGGSSTKPLTKATPEMLNKLIELLKERGVTPEELKNYIDPVLTGGSAQFTDLDLKTEEGKKKYTEICQKFISTRQSNLLNIKGEMLTSGAVAAFERHGKYVPPELALAQLTAEGGFSKDPNARPIRTKNPFNVGNTDSGSNWFANSTQDGINRYYDLIARNYLGKGKTAADLVKNFVNKNDNRYASSLSYERDVNTIAQQANKIAKTVIST